MSAINSSMPRSALVEREADAEQPEAVGLGGDALVDPGGDRRILGIRRLPAGEVGSGQYPAFDHADIGVDRSVPHHLPAVAHPAVADVDHRLRLAEAEDVVVEGGRHGAVVAVVGRQLGPGVVGEPARPRDVGRALVFDRHADDVALADHGASVGHATKS
jgi:hypothetical protein